MTLIPTPGQIIDAQEFVDENSGEVVAEEVCKLRLLIRDVRRKINDIQFHKVPHGDDYDWCCPACGYVHAREQHKLSTTLGKYHHNNCWLSSFISEGTI